MISVLHMVIGIFIEKKLTYMVNFLNLPNDYYIDNPSKFETNWVLNRSGDFMIQISFIDISLYEYLVDNSHNKKQIGKWLNRVNNRLENDQNARKWQLIGFKVIDDNGQKRTRLNFSQW